MCRERKKGIVPNDSINMQEFLCRVVQEMKILCVVLSLPKDLMFESIKSVMEQTIPVDMVVLLTQKSNKPNQAERERDILEDAYEKIDLTTFDYILKIDGQVVLPKDFLEKNLTKEPDTITSAEYQIIKVKRGQSFLRST
jgi:hypothetical protein